MQELTRVLGPVEQNAQKFVEAWNEFFGLSG